MTVYDDHKDAWDAIALYRPNISEMAQYFTDFRVMEAALCFGNSVVSKWVKKKGGVSADADRRAAAWLQHQKSNAGIVQFPPAVAQQSAGVFLVAVPDGSRQKVTHILAMLGCEVTEF